MSEHEPHMTPEARPAPQRETPDWRRLESALTRFGQLIRDGIAEAHAEQREIDQATARCIAHVLGRAYGRESALAGFGRTGEGHYLSLRDEYLDLYGNEQADPTIKEMIDWLGTYLVQQEGTGSGRRFMNEHLPPKLDQLLVHTSIRIDDERFIVNIPADWHSGHEDELIELLTTLRLPDDEALQAFLSLPDVSVGTDDIMESFHASYIGTFASDQEAVHGLMEIDEWEKEVHDIAAERGLVIDGITPDYEALLERLREAYDLVDWKGRVYAFYV